MFEDGQHDDVIEGRVRERKREENISLDVPPSASRSAVRSVVHANAFGNPAGGEIEKRGLDAAAKIAHA